MSGRVDCNPNATIYCLNGGYCSQGESLGCRCLHGYSGQHCEIEPVSCALECLNGGVCSFIDDKLVLAFDWPGDKSEEGVVCSCPTGFGGLYCEYQADICGNYEHVCLHGTKCVKDNDTSAQYSCECDGTSENCILETRFCTPSTDIALVGLDVDEYYGGVAVPSFCMNGGTCKAASIDGEWHSACECLPLFTGPRCEYILSSSEIRIAAKSIYGSDDDTEMKKALLGLLTILATGAALGIVFGARQLRRIIRRRNEPATEINLQGFREKYEEEEFIGALSPNGNMLFPALGGGRRRDGRNSARTDVFVLSDVDLS